MILYHSGATSSSTSMAEALISTRTGPSLVLAINRPEKRNALSAEVVSELLVSLEAAAYDDDVRAVVLTGVGKAFSAGADLAELERLGSSSHQDNLDNSARLASLFEAIYRHPKPIIAKVNGHAIAGGCGLAAVCDLSIAAEGVKFGFTEVRIGFVPAIVSVFVLRKLGEAAARDLFLRGRLIDSSEAAAMGLINEVVPAAQLDERVDALVDELAHETSGEALALTKKLLSDIQGLPLPEALEYAAQMNARARGTEDCKAGVRAFLSKSDPPWRLRE